MCHFFAPPDIYINIPIYMVYIYIMLARDLNTDWRFAKKKTQHKFNLKRQNTKNDKTDNIINGINPSGRAIHVPQTSTWFYGGIPGDHPCGNFLIISQRKFKGNEGEFSMWIFLPPFHLELWGYFHLEISLVFPWKNFKMQWNDLGTVQLT